MTSLAPRLRAISETQGQLLGESVECWNSVKHRHRKLGKRARSPWSSNWAEKNPFHYSTQSTCSRFTVRFMCSNTKPTQKLVRSSCLFSKTKVSFTSQRRKFVNDYRASQTKHGQFHVLFNLLLLKRAWTSPRLLFYWFKKKNHVCFNHDEKPTIIAFRVKILGRPKAARAAGRVPGTSVWPVPWKTHCVWQVSVTESSDVSMRA